MVETGELRLDCPRTVHVVGDRRSARKRTAAPKNIKPAIKPKVDGSGTEATESDTSTGPLPSAVSRVLMFFSHQSCNCTG